MKINLSKEHIERGCELVEDYENAPGIGMCYKGEDYIDKPRYRDFLQLVIEGIEDKCRLRLIRLAMSNIDYEWRNFDSSVFMRLYNNKSIIEAKEKAIAYVFDNMEVEA